MTTHVIMIIDKSGSMYHLSEDVRGGYNSYLDELAKDTEQEYKVTTVLFDHTYKLHGVDKSLAEAPRLDYLNYQASGYTALLDAIGKALTEFNAELAEGDRVLVVINTDGQENSSVEFSRKAIKDMIEQREKTGVWSFVYLGQHQDAFTEAESMGINRGNTVTIDNSSYGTKSSYSSLSYGTGKFSRGASGQSVAEEVFRGQQQQKSNEDDK